MGEQVSPLDLEDSVLSKSTVWYSGCLIPEAARFSSWLGPCQYRPQVAEPLKAQLPVYLSLHTHQYQLQPRHPTITSSNVQHPRQAWPRPKCSRSKAPRRRNSTAASNWNCARESSRTDAGHGTWLFWVYRICRTPPIHKFHLDEDGKWATAINGRGHFESF